jgi:hypothetical protein
MSGEPPKKPDTPKPVILGILSKEKEQLRNLHGQHYRQITQALSDYRPPPPKLTEPKVSTKSDRPPPPKPSQEAIVAGRIQNVRTVQQQQKELIEKIEQARK